MSDITLPSEIEQEEQNIQEQEQDVTASKPHQNTTNQSTKPRRLFNFNHLISLAIIIALAVSGMVGLEYFAFVIFSIVYMLFLSKVAFPVKSTSTERVFDFRNKVLGLYMTVSGIVGLYLPIAYIISGIFGGDKEGSKAAAPHLFLLASQVVMEGITFWAEFSIPIFAFVPVFYNSRRIFAIIEWLRMELLKMKEDGRGSKWRLHFGVALALANLAFWCFNLFGFLLPFYLPKALKKYYSASNKVKHH